MNPAAEIFCVAAGPAAGVLLLCALLGFLLAERGGVVGVWEGSSSEPIAVTDILPQSLRRCDREALRRGICAENREELLHLIEDLNS